LGGIYIRKNAFFPLFVDINDKKVLVIGNGKIARRRIQILQSFGADVFVISPEINRKYQPGDIAEINPFFVITATDDRQVNHDAMMEAKSLSIPISVADCQEECTCYFPAIAESENYIAGLVSKNGNHAGVRRVAESIRGMLDE